MLLHFTFISAVSNGKHFLIQTNDNVTGQDYTGTKAGSSLGLGKY